MTFFTGLIAFFVVALLILVVAIWFYRKSSSIPNGEAETMDEDKGLESDTVLGSSSAQTKWLELLDEQIIICEQLLAEQEAISGEEDLTLQCWATYLRIERALIEQGASDQELEPMLEDFQFVVDRLKYAQEVDLLLKQLAVSNDLLKQLNKVVQRTGEAVFEQMNITSNLNMRLDKLQSRLTAEHELDLQLSLVRAEIASMLELGERLKQDVEQTKNRSDTQEYLDALSSFIDSLSETDFIDSMRDELDYKLTELRNLSDYQADVIQELKQQLVTVKGGKAGNQQANQYEIAFARLEKALLESNRVIKSLEQKLDSLQTVRYNLTVDIRKREDIIKRKTNELSNANGEKERVNIHDVMAQEQVAMQNLVAMVDAAPLTPEYEQFSIKQSSKIEQLQQMVRESELYVEVLEKDLNQAKEQQDLLQARLNDELDESDTQMTSTELEEIENLKEINEELESELVRLQNELQQRGGDSAELDALKEKISDLDTKIDTVQTNYVAMEERYLNALMDKEP